MGVGALGANRPLIPNANMAVTKIPDATLGVVLKYALSDQQVLLAKLRYNRLVDIFTAVTCYSLQSHLRTTVRGVGKSKRMSCTSDSTSGVPTP